MNKLKDNVISKWLPLGVRYEQNDVDNITIHNNMLCHEHMIGMSLLKKIKLNNSSMSYQKFIKNKSFMKIG